MYLELLFLGKWNNEKMMYICFGIILNEENFYTDRSHTHYYDTFRALLSGNNPPSNLQLNFSPFSIKKIMKYFL